MDKEELVAKLKSARFIIQQIVRMGDDDGWRVMLANGAVIHSFDDGRCIVHGPSASPLRAVLRSKGSGRPAAVGARQGAGGGLSGKAIAACSA
jgi:hypothetical protein